MSLFLDARKKHVGRMSAALSAILEIHAAEGATPFDYAQDMLFRPTKTFYSDPSMTA